MILKEAGTTKDTILQGRKRVEKRNCQSPTNTVA